MVEQMCRNGMLLVVVVVVAATVILSGFESIQRGEAFVVTTTTTTGSSSRTAAATASIASWTSTNTDTNTRSTCTGSTTELCSTSSSSSSSDADLLKDFPLLPKEVMGKFMTAVGDPLTASSLQAGYQAGIVSAKELDTIRSKLPNLDTDDNTQLPACMSVATIEAHWKSALEGQPWHVRTMGQLAGATIVPLVAKLQEKSVAQARAMKWINENALPMMQRNERVVELLRYDSDSNNNDTTTLALNNTRATFETDRGVWSASMDVFVAGVPQEEISAATVAATTVEEEEPPTKGANFALQALKEGMGEDDISSFEIGILQPQQRPDETSESSTGTIPSPSSEAAAAATRKVGLVNAYFVPDEEIKILVVEIDNVLHNVTWKGLD